jgi:methionyl-tRNA synthetase
VVTAVAAANRDLEAASPWRQDDAGLVDAALTAAWRAAWVATEAARPLIPTAATRILAQLEADTRIRAPFPRVG